MGERTPTKIVQIPTSRQGIAATGVFIPSVEELVSFSWNGSAPSFTDVSGHSIAIILRFASNPSESVYFMRFVAGTTLPSSLGGFQDINNDGIVDTLNAGYSSITTDGLFTPYPNPPLDFMETEWHHYAIFCLGNATSGVLHLVRDGVLIGTDNYLEGSGVSEPGSTFWQDPDTPCTYVRRSQVYLAEQPEDNHIDLTIDLTQSGMQLGDFTYHQDASGLSVSYFSDIYLQGGPTNYTNPQTPVPQMNVAGVPITPSGLFPGSSWFDGAYLWSAPPSNLELYVPETLSYGFSFWWKPVRPTDQLFGTGHVTGEQTYNLPENSDGRTFWFLVDLNFFVDGQTESGNEFNAVELTSDIGNIHELIATYTDDDGLHVVRIAAYCEHTGYRNTQYGGDLRFRFVGAGSFTPVGDAESVTLSFDINFVGSAQGVTWEGGVTFLPAVEEDV